MGNGQAGKFINPDEMSLTQLDNLINEAILSNPWFNAHEGSAVDDGQTIRETLEFMRTQGCRPITAEEYYNELRAIGRDGTSKKVSLWKKIDRDTSVGAGNTDTMSKETESALDGMKISHVLLTSSGGEPSKRLRIDIPPSTAHSMNFSKFNSTETLATSLSSAPTEEWPSK